MRRTLCLLFVLVSALVWSSCKQSSEVVGNGWIQKRKHRQGFHVDLGRTKQSDKQQLKQKNSTPGLAELWRKRPPSKDSLSSDTNETGLAKRLLDEVVAQSKEHEWPGLSFGDRSAVWKRKDESLFFKNHPFLKSSNELEDRIEENDQKILLSAGGLALALLDIMVFFVAGALGFQGLSVLAIIFFPIATYAIPICAILLIVYSKEKSALSKGKTIFTPRFFYRTGRMALIFSILASILTLIGTASFILALANSAFGSLALAPFIVWLLSLFTFGITLIPAVVTIILSINHSDIAKYALLVLIVGTLVAFLLGLIAGLIGLIFISV